MSKQRDEFKKRVESLVERVCEWVEPHEWVTKPYPKKLRDDESQLYELPALFLQKGATRVLLDPIAYDVPGAEGVVDIYLMPTYDDMATLYFEQGAWTIHYTFPQEGQSADTAQVLPLREETLNQVLDSIAVHAAPSI